VTEAAEIKRGEWRFAILLTCVFMVVVAIGLSHHEMWRDELQAWLIALESPTIPSLFQNLRHEGHPALWHLTLWTISRFTASPLAMQVLHGALASCAVFLIAFYSPFSRLQRVLLAFGYFFAFEYAVLSRGYVLGVVLTFCFCAAVQRGRTSPILLGTLLGLLANTSVYGAIIALALAAATVVDPVVEGRSCGRPCAPWAIGSALFLVGMAVALATMWPSTDGFAGRPILSGGVSIQWGSAETLSHIWRTYLPISWSWDPLEIWGNHFLNDAAGEVLGIAGAFALLTMVYFALGMVRRPAALATYVLGTSGLLAFSAFWFKGEMRHNGHLFIVLVAALWMARTMTLWARPPARLGHLAKRAEEWVPRIFTVILLVQVFGAAALLAADFKYPFSGSLSVVRYMESNGLRELPVLVTDHAQAAAIAGYLGRPVYRLEARSWGDRTDWGFRPERFENDRELLAGLRGVIGEGDPALLVSERSLSDAGSEFELHELFRVDSALVSSERFVLYSARLR
jgi:hypothetical protein